MVKIMVRTKVRVKVRVRVRVGVGERVFCFIICDFTRVSPIALEKRLTRFLGQRRIFMS